MSVLPYFTEGLVVRGFGRGGKELGVPTANLDDAAVSVLPPTIANGVYYGWAQLCGGCVHKMVMSVGWNPHFENEKKSMEVHILHKFDDDFYGQSLKVVMIGFLKSMTSFSSVDELRTAINKDISDASSLLDQSDCEKLRQHPFFS